MLAEAATAAGRAPSVHNTQPWRWRVLPDRMELHADRSRQLGVSDPDGRLLMISCGAALHHARVALAAEGWRPVVTRHPRPGDPNLLAQVELGEYVGVTGDEAAKVVTFVVQPDKGKGSPFKVEERTAAMLAEHLVRQMSAI